MPRHKKRQPIPLPVTNEIPQEVTAPVARQTWLERTISRIVGVFALAFVTSVYVQVLPLVLVFLSGYIGISTGDVAMLDAMIFCLSGVALIVPLIYAFIILAKSIWLHLLLHPRLVMPKRKRI